MKDFNFQSMSINELWTLHEEIGLILSTKMEAEKLKLEQRLDELGRRTFGNVDVPKIRSYPKVYPKFRNPEPPHETWSGRGHQPRWVRELLAVGNTIDDLRIDRSQLSGRPHR